MLGETIKTIRKQKGYSQETLAQELNVVRQTISKWEKGLSVPDADMLNRLSEVLDVSVVTLLGVEEADVKDKQNNNVIADQLAILNDQFAKELSHRKRIRKIILIAASALILLVLLLYFFVFRFRIDTKRQLDVNYAMSESRIYSLTDMDEAIDTIMDDFDSWGTDCEMLEIRYAGDDKITAENLAYCNSLANGVQFDECIIFLTSFKTPVNSEQGFEPDMIYTGWTWYLTRQHGGSWVVISSGYA